MSGGFEDLEARLWAILAPYRDRDDAKVARFAVSSDGALVNLDH